MMDLKVAALLLTKVELVCRAKSSVPVEKWHTLKEDIHKFLEGAHVNIDEYRIEKVIKVRQPSEGVRQYIGENSLLKAKNERLVAENLKIKRQLKTYEQLERGIRSMLTQRDKIHKGTV